MNNRLNRSFYLMGGAVVDGASALLLFVGASTVPPPVAAASPSSPFFSVEASDSALLGMKRCWVIIIKGKQAPKKTKENNQVEWTCQNGEESQRNGEGGWIARFTRKEYVINQSSLLKGVIFGKELSRGMKYYIHYEKVPSSLGTPPLPAQPVQSEPPRKPSEPPAFVAPA